MSEALTNTSLGAAGADGQETLAATVERLWHLRQSEPRLLLDAAAGLNERARRDGDEAIVDVIELAVALCGPGVHDDEITIIGDRVIARLEELGARRWRILAMNGLASYRERRGEYGESKRLYEASLAGARETGETFLEMKTLLGLGNTLLSMGDLAGAIESHRRAEALAIELGDNAGAASASSNIGNVHAQMGDYPRALECYRRSYDVAESIGNTGIMLRCLGNMGIIYGHLEQFEEARVTQSRVLDLARSSGSSDLIASALMNLGTAEMRLRRYDTALEHYSESGRLAESLGNIASLALTEGNVGVALRELGRFDESIERIRRMLALAEEIGKPPLLERAHGYLAETYERSGDFRGALEHLREMHRIGNEWRSAETRRQVTEIETSRQVELARKEAEIERLRHVELAEAHASLQSAHEELKRAQAQLVHAEKMASLGQLTAGIAHEINNPVNFIRSSVGPLRRDVRQVLGSELDDVEREEIAAEVESLLRGIEEGAERTAAIVRGLRTFSRLDEDDLKPTDLAKGISSTLALLAPRLTQVSVTTSLDGLPPVECRPGQINQAFMNILSNAIDACDGDGSISIEGTSDGGQISIVIADTGRGMTREQIAKIFEPFYTTKDVGAGTGLGLAITHTIVEQHGGTITVESEPGSGSRFTVTLPVRARS